MRFLFVIPLFQFASTCQSQNISIKVPLFSLVDEISFPTIQSGIELKLSDRISCYNEFGVKYRKSYYELADTSFVNPHGFKLKSEIRYYQKDNRSIYFALNGFYTKDHRNTEIGYYYSNDSSDYRIDDFNAIKTVRGFDLIVGKQKRTSKHFGFDFYTGLGIRLINIKNDNIEFRNGTDVFRGPIDLNISYMRNTMDAEGGNHVLPNFSLGVRLSYWFR